MGDYDTSVTILRGKTAAKPGAAKSAQVNGIASMQQTM